MTLRSFCSTAILVGITQAALYANSDLDLAQQIAAVMAQGMSGKAHQRYAHAKGLVCEGTFRASPGAAAISRAAHLNGDEVVVTVRFSDGAPNAQVADNSPDAAPSGMGIRFNVGRGTDIMAISHKGFVVGNGKDLLALQKAIAATESTSPHPSPIEMFLGSHPVALKFVQDSVQVPDSFATESFFSNNTLIFVNSKGEKKVGRYQILPANGSRYLGKAGAADMPPNFLSEELKVRLAQAPVRFRCCFKSPNPETRQTTDP